LLAIPTTMEQTLTAIQKPRVHAAEFESKIVVIVLLNWMVRVIKLLTSKSSHCNIYTYSKYFHIISIPYYIYTVLLLFGKVHKI
jgi:hypothetical protein